MFIVIHFYFPLMHADFWVTLCRCPRPIRCFCTLLLIYSPCRPDQKNTCKTVFLTHGPMARQETVLSFMDVCRSRKCPTAILCLDMVISVLWSVCATFNHNLWLWNLNNLMTVHLSVFYTSLLAPKLAHKDLFLIVMRWQLVDQEGAAIIELISLKQWNCLLWVPACH